MDLNLTYRAPLAAEALIAFFGLRAVPGIEQVERGVYRRSARLSGGPAVIELRAGAGSVDARVRLSSDADAPAAEAAARRLFDLDADPVAVADRLGGDRLIGPLVRAAPGRRVPGHLDPIELAIRAVIGQQVSLAAAATVAGRLVGACGEPLAEPVGSVTHLFPTPEAIATVAPRDLPMPRSRARALTGLAAALAGGEVELLGGTELERTRQKLLSLPGIGPWTVAYIEMRALAGRDAFLASDLGVRRALEQLGEDGSPRAAARLAERWRPYRAYALQHLWSTLN